MPPQSTDSRLPTALDKSSSSCAALLVLSLICDKQSKEVARYLDRNLESKTRNTYGNETAANHDVKSPSQADHLDFGRTSLQISFLVIPVSRYSHSCHVLLYRYCCTLASRIEGMTTHARNSSLAHKHTSELACDAVVRETQHIHIDRRGQTERDGKRRSFIFKEKPEKKRKNENNKQLRKKKTCIPLSSTHSRRLFHNLVARSSFPCFPHSLFVFHTLLSTGCLLRVARRPNELAIYHLLQEYLDLPVQDSVRGERGQRPRMKPASLVYLALYFLLESNLLLHFLLLWIELPLL